MVRFHARNVGGAARKVLWRLLHNTARSDILAANEAKPVEALGIGKPDRLWRGGTTQLLCPILVSVPSADARYWRGA